MSKEDSIVVSDDAETGVIVWSTAEGDVTLNVFDLSPEMQRRLAVHGAKQKGTDSYAGAKAVVENGDSPSRSAFAFECVTEVVANLVNNVWSARREGGSGPRTSMLARAVAEVLGLELAAATEKLASMEDVAKKKIAAHPQIARVVLRLRQEAEAKRAEALEKQIAEGDSGSDLAALLAG